VPLAVPLVSALAAICLLPVGIATGHADRVLWATLGAALGFLGAFVGDRAGKGRWSRVALLTALAWTAGWLWTGGGAVVAAWVVVAAAAGARNAARRPPFTVLAAGSVAAVLASALVARP
jgi:hypothetical protein